MDIVQETGRRRPTGDEKVRFRGVEMLLVLAILGCHSLSCLCKGVLVDLVHCHAALVAKKIPTKYNMASSGLQ